MIEYLEENTLAVVDGHKFRRDKKSGYYLSSCKIDGKRKRLHVYIWEKQNGSIPHGYDIHHKDHNKNNNDISNLELLTSIAHRKKHGAELTEEQRAEKRESLKKNASPEAIKWHKSEQGKTWHKNHYEAMKDKLYSKAIYECAYCGKTYEATRAGFCSNACKSAYRRQSGVDNVERKCECCGKTFIANKYSTARYCEEHKNKISNGRRSA